MHTSKGSHLLHPGLRSVGLSRHRGPWARAPVVLSVVNMCVPRMTVPGPKAGRHNNHQRDEIDLSDFRSTRNNRPPPSPPPLSRSGSRGNRQSRYMHSSTGVPLPGVLGKPCTDPANRPFLHTEPVVPPNPPPSPLPFGGFPVHATFSWDGICCYPSTLAARQRPSVIARMPSGRRASVGGRLSVMMALGGGRRGVCGRLWWSFVVVVGGPGRPYRQ